jgi:hypothetical protein
MIGFPLSDDPSLSGPGEFTRDIVGAFLWALYLRLLLLPNLRKTEKLYQLLWLRFLRRKRICLRRLIEIIWLEAIAALSLDSLNEYLDFLTLSKFNPSQIYFTRNVLSLET